MSWLSERNRDGGIDRVPLPLPHGGLSLCGKHAIGPDREAALVRSGATTVVCLVEAFELEDRYPGYVEWLRDHDGAEAVWFPIPDLHAPDLVRVGPFLDGLVARLRRGEHLLMHCGAGIGRAGTMATCLLMRLGVPMGDALATVAAARPMAGPEVGAQLALVQALG